MYSKFPKFHALCIQILQEMNARDFALIRDAKNSLDRLVFELKERYYICAHELEDTSEYDALVSKEWAKLTKGKTDVDSLMTLFLCIAAGVTAKRAFLRRPRSPSLKLREHGLDPAKTIEWIKQTAPA